MVSKVLLLPGWQNSGPLHWQSRWERHYGFERVEQHEWMQPLRGDWCARLEEVVRDSAGPVTLVAHSLGCVLAAAWAEQSAFASRVTGALLVAPADVEDPALRQALPSWKQVPRSRLPFQSIYLASQDDPYCRLQRAQEIAQAWGSSFVNIGPRGHINAESGLGEWEAGHRLVQALCSGIPITAASAASTLNP